jgi:hypothetical protein
MKVGESCYLLVKTVRPAPGAQSRPRANPERRRRDRVRQLCGRSKPACVHNCGSYDFVFLLELAASGPWKI